jgi:hypothetical protein
MKKLPLFIIACLLVSITTWAGWEKPNPENNLLSRVNPTITCSADGKTIYLCYNSYILNNPGYGAIFLYKSTDGGETWSEQLFKPSK